MTNVRSLAGLLVVLSFVQCSWQVPLQDISSSETDDALMRRHSEGTFSNDYSKYLEDRKAQDFVQWLMNNKRSGHFMAGATYSPKITHGKASRRGHIHQRRQLVPSGPGRERFCRRAHVWPNQKRMERHDAGLGVKPEEARGRKLHQRREQSAGFHGGQGVLTLGHELQAFRGE
ncbi:uncharacterized protein ACBT44_004754 isoform 1-T1 [Syngnathus typhle]